MDQGRAFMSSFFEETCMLLGIRKVRVSSYRPKSNGQVEPWHRTLRAGLSCYIDSSHTNWDNLVPSCLMAYRATTNTATGYSPYYLLHGREMTLPNSDNLKVRVTKN